MNCMTECYIASAFIGGSVMLMMYGNKRKYSKLSQKQKDAFNMIKKDRTLIWVKSTIIAIFISITISKFGKYMFGMDDPFNRSCINTLVFYGVQHLSYTLYPKKDWMLNHLQTREEINWWLECYKSMQFKWHFGFVLGIIGYFFINKFLLTTSKNYNTGA